MANTTTLPQSDQWSNSPEKQGLMTGTNDHDWFSSPATIPTKEVYNVFIIAMHLQVIYILIGVIGLVGNTFVITVILNVLDLRKVMTNMFILNQSVIDAMCGIFLILTTLMGDRGTLLAGLADEVYCRVWLTKGPLWACFTSSSFNLMAITVERFMAFRFPIWYKMSFTRPKVLTYILLVWVSGFFVMIGYGVVSSHIVHGHCHVYSTGSVYWGYMVVISQYLLPIAVFVLIYTYLAFKIYKRANKVTSTSLTEHQQQIESKASKHKNIILTLLQVVICFIVCWSWNQIYYLLYLLGGLQADFASTFYHFTVVMVFCNCCCNPFVYTLSYNKFRQGAIKLVCIDNRSDS